MGLSVRFASWAWANSAARGAKKGRGKNVNQKEKEMVDTPGVREDSQAVPGFDADASLPPSGSPMLAVEGALQRASTVYAQPPVQTRELGEV